ncbi:MAG: biopolymer transporter ExbD [Calditrichaeota bacterium]|nr:MAG: biopolymer transporter ExbD [Calditrichota bacterium]
MKFETEQRYLSSFSYSSLTDIVLLLLIFFLLSSTFIIQPGIKVALPRTRTAEAHSEKSIYVTVTREGTIYLNDNRIALGQLPAELRRLLVSGRKQVVVIRADKDLPLDRAVQVMDLCKAAGAEKFLIATQPVKEG